MYGIKSKGSMIDNKIVNDSHQEGISRKIQKSSEKECLGRNGKMGKGDKAEWSRPNAVSTPRKA